MNELFIVDQTLPVRRTTGKYARFNHPFLVQMINADDAWGERKGQNGMMDLPIIVVIRLLCNV